MASTPLIYANQFFTTKLNVAGGINDTQTAGIVFESVSGVDTSKPGIALLSYSDPLNTSKAEWIFYSSINGSNEAQDVIRGAEGFSAKTHSNKVAVAFPLSERHINQFATLFDSRGLDLKKIATPTPPDSDRMVLFFDTNGKLKKLNSAGLEEEIGAVGDATNRLINGNFDIWQEGATFTTPNDNTYTADQWVLLSDGNGAWTLSQSTDAPDGSPYSMKCVNVTANKQMALMQPLEWADAIKLKNKNISISFWAKTTTGKVINNLRCSILSWTGTADTITRDVVGTWAGNGTDPTWAASYTAEVAGSNKALVSDTWTQFKVENVAIDTSGMKNVCLVIWVDDTTITVGDELYIAQASLCVAATALPFKAKTADQEQKLCMRYYQQVGKGFAGKYIGTQTIQLQFVLRAASRIEYGLTPVLLTTSPVVVRTGIGNDTGVNSTRTAGAEGWIQINGMTGGASGEICFMLGNYFAWNARL